MRKVFSCEEFAAEVLEGKRTVEWVRDECRVRRIKTVRARPYLIPQSEAWKFIHPDGKGAPPQNPAAA